MGSLQLQPKMILNGKGVFLPYTHLKQDTRSEERGRERINGAVDLAEISPPNYVDPNSESGQNQSPIVNGYIPPNTTFKVEDIVGTNKGIQGYNNSCYLDSTLFFPNGAFDYILRRPKLEDDIAEYDEVQKVLREEIVNPLRKNLFVRADRVMHLRTKLDMLSRISGLTTDEKDPEELFSAMSQVFKNDPLLEFSTGQTGDLYQIIVERDPAVVVPTVQELFHKSFNTGKIKLKDVPSVLILQMPRLL